MMDFMGLMKQAQQMQAKMAETQLELDQVEVEGVAGGGLVKLRLTAKGALKAIEIDPGLLAPDQKAILEDLIVSAHLQARSKADEAMAEKMKELTGGLQLPPGRAFVRVCLRLSQFLLLLFASVVARGIHNQLACKRNKDKPLTCRCVFRPAREKQL